MTLRTTSVRHQRQAWAYLALLGVAAYFVLVPVLGLGDPFRFFGPHQMRVLLPLVVLLRILASEFRWDGVVREEKEEKVKGEGQGGEKVGGESSWRAEEEKKSKCEVEVEETNLPSRASLDAGQPETKENHHSSTSTLDFASSPVHSTPTPDTYTFSPAPAADAAELWSRAQAMEPELDPVLPIEACESYMTLVCGAAEGGHVAAQARLGELAFNRGAFVEAYFWTKMARRRLELEDSSAEQGLKEIDGMLRNIRREWAAAGQPPEFENVYDSFPEERGELGRAFLRIDGGVEVKQTREYIRVLADKGNPDAVLFVS